MVRIFERVLCNLILSRLAVTGRYSGPHVELGLGFHYDVAVKGSLDRLVVTLYRRV